MTLAMPTSQSLRKLGKFAGLAAIAAVIGYGATFIDFGSAIHAATSKSPERYSELSFDNVASLPSQVIAGQPHKLGFHVSNHEATATNYEYRVTQVIAGKTSVLTAGRFTLPDGGDGNRAFTVLIPTPHSAAIITVTLIGRPEQLTLKVQS